jgi:hypothetical protein
MRFVMNNQIFPPESAAAIEKDIATAWLIPGIFNLPGGGLGAALHL